MSIGISVALFIFLLAATAFFVAGEHAISRLRDSRIEELFQEGRGKTTLLKKIKTNIDGYLAACHLGVAMSTIGLGWIGALAPYPVYVNMPAPLAFLIAFAVVVFLYVVIGRSLPKTAAMQKPEAISFALARLLHFFYLITYPVVYVLNGVATPIVRMFGLTPAKELDEAHTEEELQALLSESLRQGEINQAEFGYVNNIFTFDERKANEIKIPRTDMTCLYRDEPLEASMEKIKDKRFTRYPMVGENKDEVLGFINTKEFLLHNIEKDHVDIDAITRPVLTVSEQTPIQRLLKKMQTEGAHLAILIDEYGGTEGMVTIEDILEEIVGDIRDEFDEGQTPEIEEVADGHFLVDGIVLIDDINAYLPTKIEEDEFDTIGGWLFSMDPNIQEGEKWQFDTLKIRVIKRDEYRYRKLEIVVEGADG
ncbi:hemolysin family protein [Natribacillus halophilus]|uniref:Hemolysin, contains CBS domains n=1 Tax=Natribacillus halophilus TaxID=549003 RepID=A0A1G8KGP9_9BACI|nr:hemolysin family protein [Natribacillus halophilus]SDI42597.1 Hemolysin, contains CBS domains [Natribacillus halophilus]